MSTILKWAGNKTAIMPELLKHLPVNAPRLVEPFAGSCAVMMATDYPAYLVADINADLINLYRKAAEQTEVLIEAARAYFSADNSEASYYLRREQFNNDSTLTLLERAALFLYLNRHGYRGMCRYNRRGQFNVPFGNYKKPYFPEAEIYAFAEKAKRATFVCGSFEETLNMTEAGDVIYCDPPYASDDGSAFTQYHSEPFGEAEQYHLASVLQRLGTEGRHVVASNSDSYLTRSLYREFIRHQIVAPRGIGCAAGDGKSAAEIIAVTKPHNAIADGAVWFGVDLEKVVDFTPGVRA